MIWGNGRKGGFVFGLMSSVTEHRDRKENSCCTVTTFSNHTNGAVMKITFSLSLLPMWCSPRFPTLLPTFRLTKPGIFFKHLGCNKENKLPADFARMHLLWHQLSHAVWYRVPAEAELEYTYRALQGPTLLLPRDWRGDRPLTAQHALLGLSWSSLALCVSLSHQGTAEIHRLCCE